jgi:ATP-dependent 26S proteasome regulatory subunit
VSRVLVQRRPTELGAYSYSVDRNKYQIQIPLPPKIDASVTMMQVEEKPDVTYSDVGGCKEQIEKLREVVELPLLSVCPRTTYCEAF